MTLHAVPPAAPTRCGYVALLGRPNVGKSTLLNRLIAQKISITAPKPQTTRQAILGIKTRDDAQILYLDTPGIHSDHRQHLNRAMNRAALGALSEAHVAVVVITALRFTDADRLVFAHLAEFRGHLLIAVNKVDRVADKGRLLPFLQTIQAEYPQGELVPISALKHNNLEKLENLLVTWLPEAPFAFDEDQITTVSERFLVSELVREQLVRQLDQELPYAVAVEIEEFSDTPELVTIGAVIWVARDGQKAIVIGDGGARLKAIGTAARLEIARFMEKRVFLRTWVKVRADWPDDDRALMQFGYGDLRRDE